MSRSSRKLTAAASTGAGTADAYMAVIGMDPADEAGAAALRPAFASLDLLVITVITPETEQVLPAAEMPRLRSQMNDALVELVYDDPLNAWRDIPVLELRGPLDDRQRERCHRTGELSSPDPGDSPCSACTLGRGGGQVQ